MKLRAAAMPTRVCGKSASLVCKYATNITLWLARFRVTDVLLLILAADFN